MSIRDMAAPASTAKASGGTMEQRIREGKREDVDQVLAYFFMIACMCIVVISSLIIHLRRRVMVSRASVRVTENKVRP